MFRMNGRYVLSILMGLAAVFALSKPLPASAQADVFLPQATPQDHALLESSQEMARQISAIEWLGPLAPIALSPFFGLACLSGIATYGPDWLQQRSAIFSSSSPLNSPLLFWSMLVLTVATSVPRFSKVSKPLALAAEKLEAYSVVIIIVAMRVFGSEDDASGAAVSAAVPIYLASGMAAFPWDIAIALASAINILVINAVKLFCEFMIWLTPIPLIDAVVEATNKILCIGLMGLYCWSPLAATVLNLMLLAICGSVYFWTQRRLMYYVDLVVGPMLARWWPRRAAHADGETVFLAESWNGMPTLTRMRLAGSADAGWRLTRSGWWSRREYTLPPAAPEIRSGLLGQTWSLTDGRSLAVVLHRRTPGCEHAALLELR